MTFQKGHRDYLSPEAHKRSGIGTSKKLKIKWQNPEYRKMMSEKRKGMKLSPEWVANLSLAHKGYKPTVEQRRKISASHKKLVAEGKNHLWRGGITKVNATIRHSVEYKLWREAVFKRDNFTCVWCMSTDKRLNADHIKQFAFYPALRFSVENGRTLCEECHAKTETYKKRYKI